MDKLFKELIDIHGQIIACQNLIELYEISQLLEYSIKEKLVNGCLRQLKELIKKREEVMDEIRNIK